MAQSPLTISIPIKGELLLRLNGSEELHSIGTVTYTTDVNVVLEHPQSNNIHFQGER